METIEIVFTIDVKNLFKSSLNIFPGTTSLETPFVADSFATLNKDLPEIGANKTIVFKLIDNKPGDSFKINLISTVIKNSGMEFQGNLEETKQFYNEMYDCSDATVGLDGTLGLPAIIVNDEQVCCINTKPDTGTGEEVDYYFSYTMNFSISNEKNGKIQYFSIDPFFRGARRKR